MARVENSEVFFDKHRLTTSGFADLARTFLPKPVKDLLRQIGRGERVRYPMGEPCVAKVLGYSANFWIKNYSDFYRIASGNFERSFSKDLIQTIAEKGEVFVDVGSAQGYYSIIAAKAGAEVYAIDPDPVSIGSIQKNILLNTNINGRLHIVQLALGNENRVALLNIDRRGIYAPSLIKTVEGLSEGIYVNMSKFDTLVDERKVLIPQVVKIDVEGAEGLVIDGMRKTLNAPNKPTDLFMELHPKYLPMFGTNIGELVKRITSYGYHLALNPLPRGKELLCHFES